MFAAVYQISLASSFLIIFILVLRLLSAFKLPRKTFTLLWKIVLIRLLLPVTIKIPMPDFLKVAEKKAVFVGHSLIPAVLSPAGTEVSQQSSDAVAGKPLGALVLFGVWFAVMVVLLAAFIITYIRSRMHVREALPSENEYARKWLAEQKLRRKIRILSFDRIMSPVTVGVFHPKIIIPKNMEADRGKRLDYVLQHEMTHIRRFDILWKLISMLTVCIHWYNPLVWVMYRQFNRDIEIACDEGVIEFIGTKEKPDYAYAIIQLMEKKPRMALLSNGFGENPVEERIISIMKLGKKTKTGMTISLVAILLSCMVFFNTVAIGAMDDRNYIIKLGALTVGETGNEHPNNIESRKYYPVNENGYTYGKFGEYPGINPDLIYVLQNDGKFGYVYADEYFQYIDAILTNQPSIDNTNLDKADLGNGKIYNIYQDDGKTIIGTYNLK